MQALAPQIKALQQKHKGDRGALQQETMRLYQENRVNPFASCLPLLLQMPVFFALYYTIRGTDYLPGPETEALYNASFLWLPKLGEPDPYYILSRRLHRHAAGLHRAHAHAADRQDRRRG